MKSVPFALVISRLVLAAVIIVITISDLAESGIILACLILTGVLTDLFDGIIARRLGVATEKLRTWDSNVDVVFWLTAIACVFVLNPDFVLQNYLLISMLLMAEASLYVISWFRFKRTVATHTYLAKIWTFFLLVFITDLAIRETAGISFYVCFGLGMISRLEIAAILLRLKNWQTDVKSIYAVRRLNQNQTK